MASFKVSNYQFKKTIVYELYMLCYLQSVNHFDYREQQNIQWQPPHLQNMNIQLVLLVISTNY